jgi:DNA (cytosine-5)-methyltransferase 1
MTVFSRLSRYGMTFSLFEENLGEGLSMSSVVDFHVRTLVPQERESVLMESEVECGEKWRGSFTKFDPDTSSWKTHQCSLAGDLDEFLETWPQWGLMRDGECWEQQTLERLTRGTESGLSQNGVDSFHTPNTTGLDGGSNSRRALRKKMGLPTPNSRDWKDGETAGNRKSPGLGVVAHWPIPRTKGMCGGTGSWDLLKKNTTIEEARLMGAGNGGQLNPPWVEWLMGWPTGWTDLKPLEMDKCHCAPQQHGES